MPSSEATPLVATQRATTFHSSQVGEVVVETHAHGSPTQLLWHDVKAFFTFIRFIPYIVLPMHQGKVEHRDELAFSRQNFWAVFLHIILIITQTAFLLSIPLWILCPLWTLVIFWAIFYVFTALICMMLNGFKSEFKSDPKLVEKFPPHPNEQWIFINGVAAGSHWLQGNIDRLSVTFGRPVLGIHNKTAGIIFDIIQILIQRNFSYGTSDVRTCYATVKRILYSPVTKVVFVMHSQGAVEGGMILDWLLQELPQDVLSKLEVYTFGNAANHFNNPHKYLRDQIADLDSAANASALKGNRKVKSQKLSKDRKTIRYIEHYANSSDFVARWGVLHCVGSKTSSPFGSKFMGRVFELCADGHQLNQHYLDNMFTLTKEADKASDSNPFMESVAIPAKQGDEAQDTHESMAESYRLTNPERRTNEHVVVRDLNSPIFPFSIEWPADSGSVAASGGYGQNPVAQSVKVKHLSRLWLYRNGLSPAGEGGDEDHLEGIHRMSTI